MHYLIVPKICILICFLAPGVYLDPQISVKKDGENTQLGVPELRLSTELLRILAAKNLNKNVFFSPSSIYNCLLHMYFASSGNTKKTLQDLLFKQPLNTSESETIGSIFDNKSQNQQVNRVYELDLADQIFLSSDIKVKRNVEERLKKLVTVFKSKNAHEKEINEWVSKQTKGMINELYEDGSLQENGNLVFVSVAYFKGFWVFPFLRQRPVTEPFTLSDGNILNTKFMEVRSDFHLLQDQKLNAEVISIPYKGDDIIMIIILPKTKPMKNSQPPIEGILKKLTLEKFLQLVSDLQKGYKWDTKIYLPKFESKEEYDLKPVLSDLGAGSLFEIVDLTNLIETGKPAKIVSFIHKSRVKVHENGTEAAAVTSSYMEAMSMPESFRADHPFIYIIYDRTHQAIHFMGILNNP